MNQDLLALHDQLLAQHQALYQKLGTVDKPEDAKAIVTEMQELLHRIDLVQGLLFRQSTAALAGSLQKVAAADKELTEALDAAEKVTDIIAGIGKYLTVVDQAIDLAKTLAVA